MDDVYVIKSYNVLDDDLLQRHLERLLNENFVQTTSVGQERAVAAIFALLAANPWFLRRSPGLWNAVKGKLHEFRRKSVGRSFGFLADDNMTGREKVYNLRPLR